MKTLLWDAINPLTGTPFTWDDPNLRWGEPSYYLEPGDPGFVPYTTPSPNNSKPKLKAMKRQPYYPSRVADQIIWLTNFANKLAGHAATLGISPEEQQEKFSHLLDAFRFGAPPHGGLALGLDRIAMLVCGEDFE